PNWRPLFDRLQRRRHVTRHRAPFGRCPEAHTLFQDVSPLRASACRPPLPAPTAALPVQYVQLSVGARLDFSEQPALADTQYLSAGVHGDAAELTHPHA